jgi:hypothetical protein
VAVLNAVLVVVNLASGRDTGGGDPCGAPPPADAWSNATHA